MDLYPSIDLLDGRVVRLLEGDYDRETRYGEDPVAAARRYEAEGAPWVHVVDLDAARTGEAANRALVEAVVGAVAVPVQVGGGVRGAADVEALLGAGVARVVMGTAAARDPDGVRSLAESHPGRVAVGIDGRAGRVAAEGWTDQGEQTFSDLLARFEGSAVGAVVVTEVSRDGTLAGPDVEAYRRLLALTALPIVASGGVGRLDDLAALAAVEVGGRRLAGAVVGRALYEGRFTVADAVALLDPGREAPA